MAIRVRGKLVKLVGHCGLDDADDLHSRLLDKPDVPLDLSECTHLHSAVIQALLAQPREIRRVPDDAFIRSVVVPAVQRRRHAAKAQN